MATKILVIDDDLNICDLLQMYLEKEGYEVKASDFMKISVPFTLTAVLSGYLFIWIFWGLL